MVEFLFQNGLLSGNGEKFRAVCGRAGTTPHKEEGDGATPRGPLPLLRILYRADRLRAPRCAVAVEPIGMTDGWCDDIADPAYNKPVRLPYAASHEALWREDNVYDVIGVLGWNLSPILPGRGSAIFLHVATPDFAPTAGCIALALPDLLKCLEVGLRGITVAG